jgi:hypothetical protein
MQYTPPIFIPRDLPKALHMQHVKVHPHQPLMNLSSMFDLKISLLFLLLGQVKFHYTVYLMVVRAGLHYGGEGLRSVKNVWPRHGYMRQMVDVPEKN